MVERSDGAFEVEGGDRLRGWHFTPQARMRACSAISRVHDYAGMKEHGLERFARAFAEASFVVSRSRQIARGTQGDVVRLPFLYLVGIELATKAMPASWASVMLVRRRDVDRDGQV